MELKDIKGIGPKVLSLLNKLSINNVNDLITYYPYRYEILRRSNVNELNEDDKITIDGLVETIPSIYRFKNMNKMQFNINIKNNILKIVIFNRAFLKNNITIGKSVVVVGKYNKKNNTIIANDIILNTNLNSPNVIPFYSTTEGLSKKIIHTLINNALNININVIDNIPEYLISKYSFKDKYNSLISIHNPIDIDNTKKAMIRLKYEELFMFMLKINYLRSINNKYNKGYNRNINQNNIDEIIKKLPFELTVDQIKSLNEITEDLNSEKRMNRLLQGDVGSGKTIISFLSIYGMVSSSYQCALMAPTEILAKQHYENFKKLFPNIRTELLIGSLTKKQKDIINLGIKSGQINVLIGTHALIQDKIEFNNLGLVVTDEQHRFGVNQRSVLKEKGTMPDVLYMSATPIPRTYALTIYGDMDISTIKVMPKGRKIIKTLIKSDEEIKDVLYMIKSELDKQHQIYVVAPLIEDENDDSVTKLLRQYSLAFKNYNIGILHGKMKSKDKESIMNKFIKKDIDILISTTVIEVGVDVKNATMIVIHNANIFGLSTLHQLRGRVGRNDYDSYCVLIGDKNNERLNIMKSTNDGFKISEEDFKMRGSGDLFGVRQSGDMEFKIADLRKDYKILLQAKEDSLEFLNKDIENYKYIKEELLESVNLD